MISMSICTIPALHLGIVHTLLAGNLPLDWPALLLRNTGALFPWDRFTSLGHGLTHFLSNRPTEAKIQD